MGSMNGILDTLVRIRSPLGLAGAGIFLVFFVCWVFYKRTKPAAAKETPELLKFMFKGVMGLAALLIVIPNGVSVLDRAGLLGQRHPTVGVFAGRVHLGDNLFARIGGRSLPTEDAPTPPRTDANLILYDKETKTFETSFGLPTHVQWVATHYGRMFDGFNLGAWKHISDLSANVDFRPQYEGASVQIDPTTTLVWIEDAVENDEGHFYSRKAVVGRTVTKNLYEELRKQGFAPEGCRLARATLYLSGLHGSRRPDQPESVQVLVNQDLFTVAFRTLQLRSEEVVAVPIKPSSLSLEPEIATMFTIVVLPFQEEYPIPPPSVKDRRGPAHFRDIEIGDCSIELVFDRP